MGSLSLFHWVILAAVIMLLFGARRIPDVMGNFAKGINSFRRELKDDQPAQDLPPSR